jgi:hypothetical protein
LVGRVAADNRINHFFAATASNPAQLAAFKGKLADQTCQASRTVGVDDRDARQRAVGLVDRSRSR